MEAHTTSENSSKNSANHCGDSGRALEGGVGVRVGAGADGGVSGGVGMGAGAGLGSVVGAVVRLDQLQHVAQAAVAGPLATVAKDWSDEVSMRRFAAGSTIAAYGCAKNRPLEWETGHLREGTFSRTGGHGRGG